MRLRAVIDGLLRCPSGTGIGNQQPPGMERTDATIDVTDLLTLLVNGWPQKRIDDLMPWHWASQPTP
jgi:hypothetical protein